MTGRDVEKGVRILLLDDEKPYDWETTSILYWLNEAVREVARLSSDALLDDDGDIITITDLDAIGDTISIGRRWKVALIDYVTAKCFEEHGAGKENLTRADHHAARFITDMTR